MTVIESYAQAAAHYAANQARSRTYFGVWKAVRLQNNTLLVKTMSGYAIRLHDTDVVTYFPDGDIRVRTGGWLTVTTYQRIREYLPATLVIVAKVYYKDHGRRYMDISDHYGNVWHFDAHEQVHLIWPTTF